MNSMELKRLSDEAKRRPINVIGVVKHGGRMQIVGNDIAAVIVAIRAASISVYGWDASTLDDVPVIAIDNNYWRDVEKRLIAMGYVASVIEAPKPEATETAEAA
jgi:ribosomal protein S12 methylthiotransferase accessory factor YcaO